MTDRPAENKEKIAIEITPEMIEAGVNELLGHDIYPDELGSGPSLDKWREALTDAFVVMLAHRSFDVMIDRANV